jgi:hypothetical protein
MVASPRLTWRDWGRRRGCLCVKDGGGYTDSCMVLRPLKLVAMARRRLSLTGFAEPAGLGPTSSPGHQAPACSTLMDARICAVVDSLRTEPVLAPGSRLVPIRPRCCSFAVVAREKRTTSLAVPASHAGPAVAG